MIVEENKELTQQELTEQIRIRREKLAQLQAEGQNQIGRASCRERV